MIDPLDAVREAIRAGDAETARQLLRPLLQQQPSAEAWYLAAIVAPADKKVAFLDKALALDSSHEKSRRALQKLSGAQAARPAPAKPSGSSRPPTSAPAQKAAARSNRAPLLIGAAVLVVALVAVLVLALLRGGSSGSPLAQEYTSSRITLRYPAGWVMDVTNSGTEAVIISLASSAQVLDRITLGQFDAAADMTGDEVAIAIGMVPLGAPLFTETGDMLPGVLEEITTVLVLDPEARVDPVQITQIATYRAAELRAVAARFDQLTLVMEPRQGTLLVLAAITAPGELGAVEGTVQAIVESFQFPASGDLPGSTEAAPTVDSTQLAFTETVDAVRARNEAVSTGIAATQTAVVATLTASAATFSTPAPP